MGYSIKEFMGFKIKIQRLINTKSPSIKKESSNANASILKPSSEESKGSLKPIEILYHIEDIKKHASEI